MLSFDVKKKINTLRDILVGKVPDPKAQVEQITIAMIYKFMDDMDRDGAEFGSRQFFKGEYEKYAWSTIMQSENSGKDRAVLYAEGIDKMGSNPDLPALFREILKGAYIPYRDHGTLNMFLKEINEFKYDNSEDLGNAFEYLLSIMGSQGDAGQFRTPRHIIDMIVKIVAPQKHETVLDPSCGTAGFLISSYKHILDNNRDKDGRSTLSADDRKRMADNFEGYDISPDMVRLARVNMYLHRFIKPKIFEYDTLSSDDRWDDNFDVILANPPFMTPKGGIVPHTRYRVQAKRAEVLFVDYIAEHLNSTGRAGIIVPEGIVFQSANAYKQLRKYLVDDNLLYAVISLPAGVFNPYSGVKTSVLLFDRKLAKQKDEILFIKMNNDGYDLGAQRREIKNGEIDKIVELVKLYQAGEDISDNALITIATKEAIAEQDYILVGDRYKEAVLINSDYPMVELGEIVERITKGTTPTTIGYNFEDNGIKFIKIESIGSDGNFIKEKIVYINDECNLAMQRSQLKQHDILFSIAGALGRVAVVSNDILPANTNQALAVITPIMAKIFPSYLFWVLKSEVVLNKIINLKVGVAQFNLSLKQIGELQIPLPPLSVQEEIVAEIESYQKIIDGAKQIVANYKPTIKINPNWEIIKLGDVLKLSSGKGLTTNNRVSGLYNVYGGNGITGTHNEFLIEDKTIVIGRVGEYCGASHLTTNNCWVTDNALMVTRKLREYDDKFMLITLNSLNINKFAKVGGQPSISQNTVYDISIFLPLLETQQEIVEKINEEMAIVEQNKRLIEIFEQKVKDKINEVWGE